MKFINMGEVIVDVEKILYVERGKYNEELQDWEAHLILIGGVRCEPKLHIKQVEALILDIPRIGNGILV